MCYLLYNKNITHEDSIVLKETHSHMLVLAGSTQLVIVLD